ncbi:MAG: diaminopimelate decarboxylase [Acidothermus sp.]|nr:diaminopimelate decarboxylase [Acidothermus sp.]MCL6537209.1 diaminopimelate decarboxylase [Acidothermus sp.]
MATDLDPRIWPRHATRGPDGELRLAGVDVRDIAAEFGTPCYVVDEADFRSRCRQWRAAFDGATVYYAAKAFLTVEVARWVAAEGLALDVCTGEELAVALRAGFDPRHIEFHGNNKSEAELDAALRAGVGRIIVDGFSELRMLARLAAQRGVRPRILLRVTVGVEAHTHEFIATAHEDQKFGFSLAGGDAHAAVKEALGCPDVQLVGLHSHIGSQIFDTGGFEVAAHRLVGLLRDVRDAHRIELPELNLGGGVGVAYVAEDDPADVTDFAAQLRGIVTAECATAGLGVPTLAVEPGRAIAGPPTVTLYRVGAIKPVVLDGGAVRTYVSVDGGMSDNIRTALYGAAYTCTLANRLARDGGLRARVVGRHCESGDIVVRDTQLPSDIADGDLLAVAVTGAYCRAMASNYNYLGRPPVVAVRDGKARLLVRRETVDDLLRFDLGASDSAE